ncbi:MAG: LON peptidase substrate-binding domain-containing protein [Pseudomonadales bacterium]|nr:LON peptidase substrate-binding domain-containing protein [Pseudomonadales bacterium]
MAEIPLFPLPLILFPGGKLPLQIFEPRYLDMVKSCMRDNVGFGIVLIRQGAQVLRGNQAPLPSVAGRGTYCTIVDFDQLDNGLLRITVEGQVKFSVINQHEQADRLMMARVEFEPLEDETPIPANKQHLVNLLKSLHQHESVAALDLKVDFADARDIGCRLTELLPCPNEFKQDMLELDNPLERLSALEKQLLKMQDK